MGKYNYIAKTTAILLVIVTALTVLVFLLKLQSTLSESPLFSYLMFITFSLSLCIWSYRKLNSEFIVFSEINNEVDSNLPTVIKKAPKYQEIRNRHTLYYIIFAIIWFIMFMGDKPHYDEDGSWRNYTVLSNLAVEYSGSITVFDGFKEFYFKSSLHMMLFYFLNILPLLILTIGGSMVYKMSEDRLLEEQKTEDSL